MNNNEKILKQKIVFTVIQVIIYAAIRNIPLLNVDIAAYDKVNIDSQNVLLSAIGGDANQYSIFALGIAPYMLSSLLVTIVCAIFGIGTKRKISPKKMNRLMVEAMLLLSIIQAVLRVRNIHFNVEGVELYLVQVIAAIELITGAVLIMFLTDYNKKYGIGGQGVIIFANIVDSMLGDTSKKVMGQSIKNLVIIFSICIFVLILFIFLENAEIRMPVQRVSIHNIYADKNYIAIKLNPIGIMPIMFSTAVFLLPQLISQILLFFFKDNSSIIWLNKNMVMTSVLGMIVYLVIIYLLNIGLSFAFINPRELADNLLKAGDCISEFRSGKATRKYLSRVVFGVSFFSSTVMCLCIGLPFYLKQLDIISGDLYMLPTTFMMLTGIGTSLYQEYLSYRSYDSYKPFF